MLDPKLLRTDAEAVAANLARRNFSFDVAAYQALEDRRKDLQARVEELRNERNVNSIDISLDGNDVYMLELYGRDETREVLLGPHIEDGFKGMYVYKVTLERPVKAVRAVRVVPMRGDLAYSVCHLILSYSETPSREGGKLH